MIDDNQSTVRSLRLGIDWPAHGFELVGTAFDGTQGCRLIEELHPDVVITDIRMPDTDGLTLIEREQELLQDARVILITGYDKFQYAAQAIKLSVFDFILKPLDDQELIGSLLRAKKSLDRDRQTVLHNEQIACVRRRARLLSQLTANAGSVVRQPTFCDPQLHSYCFLAASAEEGFSQPLLQRLSFEAYPENLDVLSVVLEEELILFCGFVRDDPDWRGSMSEMARRLTRLMPNIRCAVSCRHHDLTEFYTACQEARQTLLEHKVLFDYAGLAFCKGGHEEEHTVHVAEMQALSQRLADADLPPEKIWEAMLEGSCGRIRQLRVLLMLYCTRTLQKRLVNTRAAEAMDTAVYDLPQISTVHSARTWFFNFCQQLERTVQDDSMSGLIRNVLDYIQNHATDGLSLESVARQFHVSPHYLSSLVRKETGVTYQQHVIQAKIAVSKKLLNDTRMRVEDIAYAVGYENYISFYNVFKRIENKTPTEYRFRNCEKPDA